MDEKLIGEFIADKQTVIEDVNTDVDLVYEALKQLHKILLFENNGTTSRLVDIFKFCTGVNTSQSAVTIMPSPTESPDSLSSTDLELKAHETIYNKEKSISIDAQEAMILSSDVTNMGLSTTLGIDATIIDMDKMMPTPLHTKGLLPKEDKYPWQQVTNLDQCDEAYSMLRKHIHDVIVKPSAHVNKNREFFIIADDFTLTQKMPHKECFDLVEEGRRIMDYFFTILPLIENVTNGGLDEGLIAMEKLDGSL